jgi:hypothetical protein
MARLSILSCLRNDTEWHGGQSTLSYALHSGHHLPVDSMAHGKYVVA